MPRNHPLLAFLLLLALVTLGLCWLLPQPRQGDLLVYCAAGFRGPMDALAQQYESQSGVTIELQYGGSNTLLSQIEVSRQGDVFLAADSSYISLGREKGLVDESIPVATMNAVGVVKRGNPHQVHALDDLLKIRLALASPDQAAIGRETRKQLEAIGKWRPMEEHVTAVGVFKPTVGEVANDVLLGSVAAGIVWDAVAAQYPDLEIVRFPELDGAVAHIEIAALSCSRNKTRAREFCSFLASSDQGKQVLKQMHYRTVEDSRTAND